MSRVNKFRESLPLASSDMEFSKAPEKKRKNRAKGFRLPKNIKNKK